MSSYISMYLHTCVYIHTSTARSICVPMRTVVQSENRPPATTTIIVKNTRILQYTR